jgi:hypothetical protein
LLRDLVCRRSLLYCPPDVAPGRWFLMRFEGVDDVCATHSLNGYRQPLRNAGFVRLDVGLYVHGEVRLASADESGGDADPASRSLSPVRLCQ